MIATAQLNSPQRSLQGFVTGLQRLLPIVRERFSVASLSIFGSFAAGYAGPQSDLDVLVTFSRAPSLFKLVELENYLTDHLAVKVDLVMKDSLRPGIGQRVLQEVVPV